MTKTIRLGIALNETWGFFNEIFSELERTYITSIFKRTIWNVPVFHDRVNRLLYKKDLVNFMNTNDVVFFEWASELLAAATRLPKRCGIITRLHRYEMYEWVNRINWDAVDKLIVVSQAKKNEFLLKFPEQSQKIVVSSPSTSLEKFFPDPRHNFGNIGILCQLTPRKRVYDLILDFYELAKVNNDFHLHIAGGIDPAFEDYYSSMQYIVNNLNLNNKVTFYGNVTDPWNWYQKIDIFISNSYSEGLQVALMEAMASGCYCLSHRWSGVDEMLPLENLFFSGTELQEKILQYSEMTEMQKNQEKVRMRSIACEKFDIRQTITQIKEVINSVI